MKQFILSLAITATIIATGCADNNTSTPTPGNKSEWESYTHAQLLKMKGNVKHVRISYVFSEEESILQLNASFDAQGHCMEYDPTGIDFSQEPLSTDRKATRGFGVSTARYTYTYDAQGRMTNATKYDVGADPVVYKITYGTHNALVVTPFPLGNITPFMLRGVSHIEATNYELTCDGSSATEVSTVLGWGSSVNETAWTYAGSTPTKGVTIAYERQQDGSKGDQMKHSETTYIYKKSWLYRMETVITNSGEEVGMRTVTEFSTKWPCTPVFLEDYTGDATTPDFRTNYTYMDNGQPQSVVIAIGQSLSEEPFQQHYTTYDDLGNWTAAIRTISTGEDTMEIPIVRVLTYY